MFGCQGRFAARWEEVLYHEVLLEEGGVVVPCHETYIDLLVAEVATIERKTCKPMSTGRLPPLVFDHVSCQQQSHRNELCLLTLTIPIILEPRLSASEFPATFGIEEVASFRRI